ncbi:MAG: ParB N-terminal domain-containing protein [Candidatus Competibacteraceae bacterium]|nr:ParB N-terminal domain-containing protein [Candidatus Competibacteraceae bacterium]
MHEEIELDRLYISPSGPRHCHCPWPTADELARARETGLIEPVIVRPLPGTRPPDYEILFGLKRWLLAQRLSLATVPIIVRAVSDETARRWVAADNNDGSMENPSPSPARFSAGWFRA